MLLGLLGLIFSFPGCLSVIFFTDCARIIVIVGAGEAGGHIVSVFY